MDFYLNDKKKMVDNHMTCPYKALWIQAYHMLRTHQRNFGSLPDFPYHRLYRFAWRIVAQRKMIR